MKKVKTNKTKVINSINIYNNRNDEYIKEIIKIKSRLKKCNIEDDILTIEYKYNRLIELYYLSNMNHINWEVAYILKEAILLIIESDVNIKNSFELINIKRWIEYKAI